MREFWGLIPALITPFKKDGSIDFDGLGENVDVLLRKGAHGFLAGGGTGEHLHMDIDEWRQVVRVVMEHAQSKVPILVGAFGLTSRAVIEKAKYAEESDADGVLVPAPYLYPLEERELYQFYKDVSDSVNIPITIYNAPFAAKVSLSPALVVRLIQDCSNIRSLKDASGDIRATQQFITSTHGALTVFEAWDSITIEAFVLGAKGWITSAAGNLLTEQASKICDLAIKQKNFDKAREIYFKLIPFLNYIDSRQATQWLTFVHEALNMIGLKGGYPRKPLLPPEPDMIEEIRKVLKEIAVI